MQISPRLGLVKMKMNKGKEKDFMEVLPSEVRSDILSRLPVESLVQCRSVCKSWCALIDDPFLRKTHTERLLLELDNHCSDYGTVNFLFMVRFRKNGDYKLQFVDYYDKDEDEDEDDQESFGYWVSREMDYPPKPTRYLSLCHSRGIIGSCNGLVCLGVYDHVNFSDHIYMLNPVTREYLNLPSLYKGISGRGATPHGFGYNSSTDEYKIVRIRPDRKIDVYTLGSGKWRTIGDVPSLFRTLYPSNGVLSYGALHWIDYKGKIASFDLVTEEFHVIPSPCKVTLPGAGSRYCRLGVWRRSLCLVICDPLQSIQIWVMKNGEQSWTQEIKIPVHCERMPYDGKYEYRFITLSETGNILFWYNNEILVSYDPIKNKFTSLDLSADWFSFTAVLHTKSFVSMKALGEDTKILGKVQRR